jgi:hypothetical protein
MTILQQAGDQYFLDIEAAKAAGRTFVGFWGPSLHLESDYSESDTEQLRVRIEAYLEMF